MKGFKEWILKLEMPLVHYGHEFHSENDPEEGFLTNKAQAIVRKTTDPWGGEVWSPEIKNIGNKFSRRDKVLISHPRTARLLEEKLKNSKYNFNILMIETDLKRDSYSSQVYDYMKKNNLKVENHITFVKNATSGHVMTPWMILHTLGHAVTDFLDIQGSELKIEKFKDIFGYIIAWVEVDKAPATWSDVFAFGSAKKGMIDSTNELIHELIAEYLWNGHIRPSEKIKGYSPQVSEKVTESIKSLEVEVTNLLDNCVGYVIYDAFI